MLRDALQRGVCHLWYLNPASLTAQTLERGLALLSTEEMARYKRFLVPVPAQTFLAARILVRSVLSLYYPLDPAAWRFESNPWGRPYIANPEAPPGLVFNLSHKPGLVTCLAGMGRDLGVDVEDCSANRTYLIEIASRFFSPSEASGLLELPEAMRPQRFFELWTLKEAYIKARGRGLSLGLSHFSFAIGEQIPPMVHFDEGFDDDPQSWDFRFFRPDERHLIATAVRRSPDPLVIEAAEWEPSLKR